MFSLRFTLFLLIVLLVPLILRFKFGGKFEPFPAILLPSGASKTLMDATQIEAWSISILAQKEDKSWSEVDTKVLLYPIPANNHNYIFRRDFGIANAPGHGDRRIVHLMMELNIIRDRESSREEKENTKAWLRERLYEQGFTGHVLKKSQKGAMISIQTGETLTETIIDERIIFLD